MKKLLLAIIFGITLCMPFYSYSATSTEFSYTTPRTIDTGTFNEYRYKITEQFFTLRSKWEVDGELHKKTLESIGSLAANGYKYLPDNLKNKNYLRKLLTDLQKGTKQPNNDANYTQIIKSISDFIDKVDIQAIKGTVKANPKVGNAPMNVTLRGKVVDPTGTQIPEYNYTWWIDDGGKRVVIGRGLSLNYNFREEGKFSVFLDVVSNHRNSDGNIDVLPFRSRADIEVKEKIASLIIKVNGDRLRNQDVLKFTPSESGYGLIFDATSSTPTGGARFIETEWDFGNGVRRIYKGAPRIERVNYGREGNYTVKLQLRTNELKTVTRDFEVSIHDPIATISSSKDDGFIGEKFTFSAKASGNEKNLSYSWEIIDINNDDIILRKTDKLFTYIFTKKGKFNIKLRVTQPSGEVDIDTQILYINSRAPIADFSTKIPLANKPNRVFIDGSRSSDPDFSDDGKLTFTWFIDGEKVNLEDANSNGSVGYYVFDTVGNHDINLEVRDPDNISALKKSKIKIDSILSVEMFAFPRVVQRDSFIRFVAESPEAEIFEWDFGDGIQKGGNDENINHTFHKSGAFDVKLKVRDADNKFNTFTKTVYIGESDSPVAILDVQNTGEGITSYDAEACGGKGAYRASRVDALKFDANDSINIDGENSGLEYSWKIGNSKFATTSTVNHKFDEIGCFPVKVTVKSKKNGKTSTRKINVDIVNETPIVSALDISIQNPEADPLVVDVIALGAKDPDGVIQSYLWYYYTDTDSEPQDFRSSSKPGTTFVLPKIAGQYYFVVVLKDNNEARVTSEEVTGSKFFTTITGDNINTPLLNLSIDDSSVSIGEEVSFSVQVKDILGRDISKKAKFSWDFDGDGFYDTQTSSKQTTYKYKKSGTFYAKVKVKHKGISSTKTITVNVSNKIVPNFEYISIGNTYIFFDTSNGELDTRDWDLGDGTKISGKTFTHKYDDKKPSHSVILKVSEGDRNKEVTKKVVKNVKNVLSARGKGLNLFTTPSLDTEGNVTLENEYQKFYVYMGESRGDIAGYAIDYDLDLDSDLNGGKDDDTDNKGTGSYTSGDVVEVPLNQIREQTVRVYLLDVDGKVLESKEIKITKEHIEERSIDFGEIEFLNVTSSEKEKIGKLKELLSDLPQSQKLSSMNYVQRMQESWSDQTEKTRIIIEFETYLYDQDVANVEDIVTILEGLLVEGQEDTSEKNVAFHALKNLIPETIECPVEGDFANCSEMLTSQLEAIRESKDIEQNKTLGSGILSSIQNTETMTNQQKIDFKAILSSLVYGGVSNIPEQEVNDVIEQETSGETGGFMSLLLKIFYGLGIFILVMIGLVLLYFIYFKLVNKDKERGFQDFIIDKTSMKKEKETESLDVVSDNGLDVLSDELKIEEKPSSDILSSDTSSNDVIPDPLAESSSEIIPSRDTTTDVVKKDEDSKSVDEEQVPDWLAGNFSDDSKSTPENVALDEVEDKKQPFQPSPSKEEIVNEEEGTQEIDIEEETKIEEEQIPDWLKGDIETAKENDDITLTSQEDKDSTQSEGKKPPITPIVEDETKIEDVSTDTEQVPDWLKDDLSEGEKNKSSQETKGVHSPKEGDSIIEEDVSSSEVTPTKKEEIKGTPKDTLPKEKIEDASIPDWLSGSFGDDEESVDEGEDVKEKPSQAKVVEKPAKKQVAKTSNKKKAPMKKAPAKKKPVTSTSKDTSQKKKTSADKPAKKVVSKASSKEKTSVKKKNTKKNNSELWDDGMKVPDWLKTGDE